MEVIYVADFQFQLWKKGEKLGGCGFAHFITFLSAGACSLQWLHGLRFDKCQIQRKDRQVSKRLSPADNTMGVDR